MKLSVKFSKLMLSIFFISFTFIGCSTGKIESTLSVKKTENNQGKIQQNQSDLLAGVSRAICYSGFREGQHPDRGDGAVNPSYAEILEDLQILTRDSNFRLIRLYDSGENSQMVLRVIKENNLNLNVLLGIWLKAELSNHEGCPWLEVPIPDSTLKENKELNLKEIETGIMLANKYQDIIVSVNVGNEALVEWNDHLVDTQTIIDYVRKVQGKIRQPVTVADNFRWWVESGMELSKIVDYVSIHVYPLWEGQDIDTAMEYSIANVKEVCEALPKSKIVITELGWPTVSSEYGEIANEENQLRYFNEMMEWADEINITTVFFEAFDEPWKGNPENILGAEKHWGIFTVDRKPKLVMQKMYPDLN